MAWFWLGTHSLGGSTLHMNLSGINVINYLITVIITHCYYQQKYLFYWLVCMLDWLFGPYTHYLTIVVLRWVPTKIVKVQGLSWKSGKIKMMCVWFHSHKASGVNPAWFCRYESLYFITYYPKTYLRNTFYLYAIIQKWYLKRLVIPAIERQPITQD